MIFLYNWELIPKSELTLLWGICGILEFMFEVAVLLKLAGA